MRALLVCLVLAASPDAGLDEYAALIRGTSPDALISLSRQALAQLPVYRMRLVKRERMSATLDPAQTLDVVVRAAPLGVRADWVAGPHEGRHLVYDATVRPKQMHVKEPGLRGLLGALWIGVDGSLAKDDSHHPVTEMPLSALLDLFQRDFERAAPQGGFAREDLGWNAEQHWCIRYTAPPKAATYARRARICVDPRKRLPTDVDTEDDKGLLETFRYGNVEPAVW